MTRVAPATLLVSVVSVACLALGPAGALAKVPDPRFSGVPEIVVGCPSGAAQASCGTQAGDPMERVPGFRVLVRGVNNDPLWFVEVVLDFSATTVHLIGDDRPGTTVDCAARTIRRLTDQHGEVVFAPRFCGGTEEARVQVIAYGVTLREIRARSTDLDADGSTGLYDFSRVAQNFLTGAHDPATDFDPCAPGEPGRTTLQDLATFGAELLRGSNGVACP